MAPAEAKDWLGSLCEVATEAHFVGSRVTCDPIPAESDCDILVKTENWQTFLSAAIRDGWGIGGSMPDKELHDYDFVSLTKGDVNILMTEDATFVRRFLAATGVAKRMNLLHKPDRIMLFQAVLYGNAP